MLFPHTWPQVLRGEQTQTRRPVQAGDTAVVDELNPNHPILEVVRTTNGGVPRMLFQVGQTYPVQPGPGKKSVGYILVTAIRRERLQDITAADALKEFPPASLAEGGDTTQAAREHFRETWDKIYPKEGARWQDNPEVWVLDFSLIGKNITNP